MIAFRGRSRTALRFGTGPDIWMNLQKNYELRMAAQAIGDARKKIPVPQT
jgi:plasmid maintenance system antidote protein VapI